MRLIKMLLELTNPQDEYYALRKKINTARDDDVAAELAAIDKTIANLTELCKGSHDCSIYRSTIKKLEADKLKIKGEQG